MATVLEGLARFIATERDRGIAPDLLDRWSTGMETQVLVSGAGGEPVDEKPGCYTNGMYSWWNIRVPKNANSEPEFKDYPLTWFFEEHADCIGSTGWNWQERRSCWVGFDFDALVGHAQGVGVTDDELNTVREKAMALPYVEVRRSTGGNGLHLYVHVDIPAENHTVHAGLARCILSMMSAETGFDFAKSIDCCGGNMWIWRKDLEPGGPGLSLIKEATHYLDESDLPSSWRDYITVVKKSGKVATDETAANLAAAIQEVPLDEEHRALIDGLGESGYAVAWVNDYHCLHTKTKALQDVFESQVIPIKGVFRTVTEGNEPSKPNCYMFPLEGGAWKVFRFNNAAEADTWTKDSAGRTTCFFNKRATLKTAAMFYGGSEDADNGEFVMTYDSAIDTARCLGEELSLPAEARDREVRLAKSKDGRLVVKIKKDAKEKAAIPGWIDKKSSYTKVLQGSIEDREDFQGEYDEVFRKLVSPGEGDAGWVLRNQHNWVACCKDDIKNRLESLGVSKRVINALLGNALYKPWKLVNLPFQGEYPGGRLWNLNAAQFLHEPAAEDEAHPHWDLVLSHCGADLDAEVANLDWCRDENILTGKDYLLRWIASAFRCPFEPLPYLFFFGPQNCGKSTFHEAISLLTDKGCVRANRALTGEFNGMLENAVFCVVEEQDIATSKDAKNKIKDWVTSKEIEIRKMRTDPYMMPNATKWIQCANERAFCPIFKGDTRITAMYVGVPVCDLPKEELLKKLNEEAPAFMRTLLTVKLPEPRGRLRLPVIETANKKRAIEVNCSPFESFVSEALVYAPGSRILLAQFNEQFERSLADADRDVWGRGVKCKHFDALATPVLTRPTKLGKALLDVRWAEGYATSV